jgi:hypothetical protein
VDMACNLPMTALLCPHGARSCVARESAVADTHRFATQSEVYGTIGEDRFSRRRRMRLPKGRGKRKGRGRCWSVGQAVHMWLKGGRGSR